VVLRVNLHGQRSRTTTRTIVPTARTKAREAVSNRRQPSPTNSRKTFFFVFRLVSPSNGERRGLVRPSTASRGALSPLADVPNSEPPVGGRRIENDWRRRERPVRAGRMKARMAAEQSPETVTNSSDSSETPRAPVSSVRDLSAPNRQSCHS
jgi:hypothetical protein